MIRLFLPVSQVFGSSIRFFELTSVALEGVSVRPAPAGKGFVSAQGPFAVPYVGLDCLIFFTRSLFIFTASLTFQDSVPC